MLCVRFCHEQEGVLTPKGVQVFIQPREVREGLQILSETSSGIVTSHEKMGPREGNCDLRGIAQEVVHNQSDSSFLLEV